MNKNTQPLCLQGDEDSSVCPWLSCLCCRGAAPARVAAGPLHPWVMHHGWGPGALGGFTAPWGDAQRLLHAGRAAVALSVLITRCVFLPTSHQ